MASRLIVQQQNAGEAVLPGAANKQKKVAEERKNRRALGDIGNVVTARGGNNVKPLPQISRPITRGFCARLQAEAVNVTEANAAPPNKRGAAAAARKPAQKNAGSSKPKPEEEVIVISPDTNEAAKKKVVDEEKAPPTLTSTLTARSKAACGPSKKPVENLVDIDAVDVGNDLAVVEYVDEIYKFYKLVENEGRAYNNYMDSQPEINEKMRAILVDWLVQVHHKFELSPETLYLTINVVDRYLASKTTCRRELQLVGMSSMLIASKYEEIWAPEVNDLVCVSDGSYSGEQVRVMEKRILGALEWNLTVPTPYVFLVRFIKASMTDSDVENMVYFLGELGMMNYAAALTYSPSMIAAAAVYAARSTLDKAPLWNETLRMHTGFSEPQLVDCAKMLVSLHSVAADQKLKGVYRKYCGIERGAVALLPPAKSVLGSTNCNSGCT